jgi:L-lactate dehydrogenase complex protein LldF
MPSHIIAPAVHKTVPQVARLFSEAAGEPLPDDRTALCAFARQRLRSKFLAADMGITGVNFAAVDTGTIVLVTNEGNGRMCTSLPRVHVAVMPVEKVIPRFEDLGVLLPLLTRTATGQRLSTYVSMITGPRRPGEIDGPEKLHVIFLDHNRRSLLGTPYEEMLCCIRCGACLNVCPVYRRIGGHAYDAVYSGPMGAVLTPLLSGGTEGRDLPDASSLCGACSEVCPVGIPLADLLVRLRADLRTPGPAVPPSRPWAGHEGEPTAAVGVGGDAPGRPTDTRPGNRAVRRVGFGVWAHLWASPTGYRLSAAAARRLGRLAPPALIKKTPLVSGWGEGRDIPLPAARSFRQRLATRKEDGW